MRVCSIDGRVRAYSCIFYALSARCDAFAIIYSVHKTYIPVKLLSPFYRMHTHPVSVLLWKPLYPRSIFIVVAYLPETWVGSAHEKGTVAVTQVDLRPGRIKEWHNNSLCRRGVKKSSQRRHKETLQASTFMKAENNSTTQRSAAVI